jgi:hypothetical protein
VCQLVFQHMKYIAIEEYTVSYLIFRKFPSHASMFRFHLRFRWEEAQLQPVVRIALDRGLFGLPRAIFSGGIKLYRYLK